MAICLPGIASSVNRAATSATRPAPFVITMNWINLATLAIDNEFAPAGTEHATTLDIKGVGVMLRGDSGVGKSELALELITRGHGLVADDVVEISISGLGLLRNNVA